MFISLQRANTHEWVIRFYELNYLRTLIDLTLSRTPWLFYFIAEISASLVGMLHFQPRRWNDSDMIPINSSLRRRCDAKCHVVLKAFNSWFRFLGVTVQVSKWKQINQKWQEVTKKSPLQDLFSINLAVETRYKLALLANSEIIN